jgi:hypothetical protein
MLMNWLPKINIYSCNNNNNNNNNNNKKDVWLMGTICKDFEWANEVGNYGPAVDVDTVDLCAVYMYFRLASNGFLCFMLQLVPR